ncbi:hypothetical protein YC2023_033213 [Brassica napus]
MLLNPFVNYVFIHFSCFHATSIPATLNVHRLTTYRNMYSLGGFDVPRCNQNYRLYDSPFLIQFSDSPTELVLPILQVL